MRMRTGATLLISPDHNREQNRDKVFQQLSSLTTVPSQLVATLFLYIVIRYVMGTSHRIINLGNSFRRCAMAFTSATAFPNCDVANNPNHMNPAVRQRIEISGSSLYNPFRLRTTHKQP